MSELAMIFYKHVKHHSKCMVCGSVEHLNMHHIAPADKITEILKIARHGDMVATIAEIQKTIPVCEFDHRRIHRGQLKGWLDGYFDNGKLSTAENAYKYSPYLNWFASKRPEVMFEFYRNYIEKNHRALWPVFNAAGICLPKHLRLALVVNEQERREPAPWPPGGTIPLDFGDNVVSLRPRR